MANWHLKWTFTDHATGDVYTFRVNPNQMSSPFPVRNIQSQATTALNGQPILYEAAAPPREWTFGGAILTGVQYEELRSWAVDRKGWITVTDHYGRRLTGVFTQFDPSPRRGVGRYWYHDYTIHMLLTGSVSAPTVQEVPA